MNIGISFNITNYNFPMIFGNERSSIKVGNCQQVPLSWIELAVNASMKTVADRRKATKAMMSANSFPLWCPAGQRGGLLGDERNEARK